MVTQVVSLGPHNYKAVTCAAVPGQTRALDWKSCWLYPLWSSRQVSMTARQLGLSLNVLRPALVGRRRPAGDGAGGGGGASAGRLRVRVAPSQPGGRSTANWSVISRRWLWNRN